MKRILIPFLLLSLVGCAGRPPAPVNNYGSPNTNTPTSMNGRPALPGRGGSSDRNNRPPLPSSTTTTTNAKPVVSTNKPAGVLSGQEIFKKCNSAVFMIFTSTGYSGFQGSGFFISPDGLAVSNYHVFEGTGMGLETIKLSNDNACKLRDVIFKDKENDVMVFTVDAPSGTKFNYIPISSRSPQVGDKAYAIGSPRGLENTFSSGEISQFRDGNVIQISVPIDNGSSGGALINEYGEVIGITSSGYDGSGANLNFAVNISVVRNRLGR